MPKVVEVTLRGLVRGQAIDANNSGVKPGECAVVRTARGLELARVRSEPREVPEGEVKGEPRTIERRATAHDLRRAQENEAREHEALLMASAKAAEHGLQMKMISAECTLEGNRMVLHFSAEGRVDFRALVRDLARLLRARIELHQVGVRDEAKMRGGLGPCGRPLCCASFLTDFEPVGIRMAKDQDLSLNPQKISGVCSRLMCCLNYEYGHYRESKRCCPRVGAIVTTEQGTGKLIDLNVLRQEATVLMEEGRRVTMPLSAVAVHKPGCPHRSPQGAAVEEDEPLGGDAVEEE